jgi:hypothetical protein
MSRFFMLRVHAFVDRAGITTAEQQEAIRQADSLLCQAGRNVQRPDNYLSPDPPASYMVSPKPFKKTPGTLLIEQ